MIDGFLIAMVLIQAGALGVLAFSNARLWVELIAMKNSTHNIQFMDPVDLLRQQESEKKLTREEEAALGGDGLNSII